MDDLDWKRPALIGGLISGILSAMPFVNALNYCLCLWAWVGGAVASKLLIGRSHRIVTGKDGARVGLYSGLIAGAIVLLITTPLTFWQMDRMLQAMITFTSNMPEAQSYYIQIQERLQGAPALKLMISFVIAFVTAALILGFTVLGGLLGAALFENRRSQPPPPPYPSGAPSSYPPGYPAISPMSPAPQAPADNPSQDRPQSGGSGADQDAQG
jgi:hypothetical protein